MTPADLETARAWVAEPDFRWMPGMLNDVGERAISVQGGKIRWAYTA